MLQHGEYALVVTGTDTFVDGNWENSAALSGGAHLTPSALTLALALALALTLILTLTLTLTLTLNLTR